MPTAAAVALLAELEQEAHATRKVLERVPREKLAWKPHPKSMTLGQLALHVANLPGNISRAAGRDGMDAANASGSAPQPENDVDLVAKLEAGIGEARAFLSSLDDARGSASWRMSFGDREIFTIPKLGVIRTMLLNHWYHHRGQLTVYLRLLDVPVPVIYGRSADESTFTKAAGV